jgi:hypothetical protein
MSLTSATARQVQRIPTTRADTTTDCGRLSLRDLKSNIENATEPPRTAGVENLVLAIGLSALRRRTSRFGALDTTVNLDIEPDVS